LIDKLFALISLHLGLLGMNTYLQKNSQPSSGSPLFFPLFSYWATVVILLLYPQVTTSLIIRKGKKWEKHTKLGQIVSSLECYDGYVSANRWLCFGSGVDLFATVLSTRISIHVTPFFAGHGSPSPPSCG